MEVGRPGFSIDLEHIHKSTNRGKPSPTPSIPPSAQSSWTHDFYCLSSTDAVAVPVAKAARKRLSDYRLGEKHVQIGLNASALEFHEAILAEFFLLRECWGYTLLKCIPNSRNLQPIVPPPSGHTPKSLRGLVGQSRVYIRPLQKDISLIGAPHTAVSENESVSVDSYVCFFCQCQIQHMAQGTCTLLLT